MVAMKWLAVRVFSVGQESGKLDEMLFQRRKIADQYINDLSDCNNISLPIKNNHIQNNWQSLPIKYHGKQSQKQVVQYLSDCGIATRRGIMNAHQEEPYTNTYWSLPVSEDSRDMTILLPLYHEMTSSDLENVTHCIRNLA